MKNTAGVYSIIQGTLTAGTNYTISFTPGSYTVKAKQTNRNASGGATCGMMLINTTTPDGYQVGADGS